MLIDFFKLDEILHLLAIVLGTYFFLDIFLVLDILLSYVMEKVSEQPMVIDDQFVDDCPVDILRWEFVLIAFFYHLSHVCEVLRDCWSILLDYQVVVTDNVLKEASVVRKVL